MRVDEDFSSWSRVLDFAICSGLMGGETHLLRGLLSRTECAWTEVEVLRRPTGGLRMTILVVKVE